MRYVFMGSPQEVIAPLNALLDAAPARGHQVVGVVSQAAKPVGRKLVLTDPPVAQFAKARGLNVLQPERASSPEFLAALRALEPDVIVTAAYGQMLGDEFLTIPRCATINIHPSLLPAYRGATPVPAALLDGLSVTGVTVLFTVKAMDAGHVIVQREFAIGPHETGGELTARLFQASGALLWEALDKLEDPHFVGTPQDQAAVTRCRKIKKEDGMVNWNLSAAEIYNRFRAYQPWPGSATTHGERRISLAALRPWNGEGSAIPRLAPGAFVAAKAQGGVAVGTGSGEPLVILRLTPQGGKEMEALAYLNGLKAESERCFA